MVREPFEMPNLACQGVRRDTEVGGSLLQSCVGVVAQRREERGNLVAAAQALNVFPANLSIQHLPVPSPHPARSLAYDATVQEMQQGRISESPRPDCKPARNPQYSSPMKHYDIAVIGGDGTGPEVVREAVKVLEVAAKKFELKLNYTPYDLGGERYLRTGEALPDSVLAELRKFPAILLGAIGHPDVKPGILEKGILLRAALRAGAIHQPAPGEALRRALLPAEGQEARGH